MGKALAFTAPSLVREVLFGVGFALLPPRRSGLDGALYSMPVSGAPAFLIGLVPIIRTFHFLDDIPKSAAKFCEN